MRSVTNRQLLILIGVVVTLSLTLAWMIERTQIRNFMVGFDRWWEAKNGNAE